MLKGYLWFSNGNKWSQNSGWGRSFGLDSRNQIHSGQTVRCAGLTFINLLLHLFSSRPIKIFAAVPFVTYLTLQYLLIRPVLESKVCNKSELNY